MNVRNKNLLGSILVTVFSALIIAGVSFATSNTFTPPAGTTPANNYRTLGDIYAKLTNFNLNPSATHSVSTTTTPTGTFYTLEDIYTKLTDENNRLTSSNIKNGVTIFGVTGNYTCNTNGVAWSTEQPENTWVGAMSACSAVIDGSTGWRLPTRNELLAPMFNQFILGTEDNGFRIFTNYWTSEQFDPTLAWVVSYYGATALGSSKFSIINNVRTPFRCIKP